SRPPRHAASETDRIGRSIRWLVRRRVVAVVVIVVLAAGGYVAWGQLSTGFLPQMDEGAFVIDFFLPAGTSLEETARATAAIDDARIVHAQLARLGVDAQAVGQDLSIALAGREVAQVLRPERTIGVRLRYPDDIRYSAEALARSPIAYGPRALPLGQVVAFDRPLAPAVLRRDGLRSAVVMTAATRSGDRGGAGAAVRKALAGIPLPPATALAIG